MSSTIYVGIDGSEPSASALRWSIQRAGDARVPIVLVHVIDYEHTGVSGVSRMEQERIGESILADAAHRSHAIRPELSLERRIARGRPTTALSELGAPSDLLVIGTHKTGFLRGRVLGSRSVIIASSSCCSVAVVPNSTSRERRDVVVGVDAVGGSNHAIDRAGLEAQRADQELLILHAIPRCTCGSSSGLCPGCLSSARQVVDAAIARARRATPGLAVRGRVVRSRPAEALVDASQSASLLVLDGSHPAARANSPIGSVTLEALLNLTSPVLVVR